MNKLQKILRLWFLRKSQHSHPQIQPPLVVTITVEFRAFILPSKSTSSLLAYNSIGGSCGIVDVQLADLAIGVIETTWKKKGRIMEGEIRVHCPNLSFKYLSEGIFGRSCNFNVFLNLSKLTKVILYLGTEGVFCNLNLSKKKSSRSYI